jgi:hypothetical protein
VYAAAGPLALLLSLLSHLLFWRRKLCVFAFVSWYLLHIGGRRIFTWYVFQVLQYTHAWTRSLENAQFAARCRNVYHGPREHSVTRHTNPGRLSYWCVVTSSVWFDNVGVTQAFPNSNMIQYLQRVEKTQAVQYCQRHR